MNTAEVVYVLAPLVIGLILIIAGLVYVFKRKPRNTSNVEIKKDGISLSRVSAGIFLVILGVLLIYWRINKGISFYPNGQPSTIRTTTPR